MTDTPTAQPNDIYKQVYRAFIEERHPEDAVTAIIAEALAAARADERAKIVAWLRREYETSAKSEVLPIDAIHMIDVIRRLIEEGSCLADAIESGEADNG